VLGLWVGDIAAIDFVEAPARFRTPDLDRNEITAVGRSVFHAFSLAATITALSLVAARAGEDDGKAKTTATLVGTILALSVVQQVWLQPTMRALQDNLGFVNRDESDPRYGEHRKFHGAYMAADGVKFLLGLAANATE